MALSPKPATLATLICLGLALGSQSAVAAIWPSAARRLEAGLTSGDASVRLSAVTRLGELPRATARRLLSRALDDVDSGVASAALELSLRLETPQVTERVVHWLSGPDKKLRLSAALALAQAPATSATIALGRALGDSDAEVRAAAAAALGVSESAEAVLALLGHLDDAVPEVREAVAGALGTLGDARAVLPLIGKVEDSRASVRAAVARALGMLRDTRSASALLLALRDPDKAVVVAVVRALGRLAERAAVAPLGSLLASEPELAVRRSVLWALGNIASPEAARVLVQELSVDEPGREREPVLAALALKPEAFTASLRSCLEGASGGGAAEGCALALSGARDLGSAGLVRAALDRGRLSPKVGLQALARLGDSRSLSAALERLTAPDAETRAAATAAAEALLSPAEADGRAVEPIVRALSARDTSRAQRLRLVSLLGRSGSERATGALLPLLQNVADPELAALSALALGNISSQAAGTALLAALDSEEPRVRRAAAVSIRRQLRAELLGPLLVRFERAGASQRALLAQAMFGPMTQTRDDGLLERVGKLLRAAHGGERDALIEALAASLRPAASSGLLALSSSVDAADRAKAAEVLASRPGAGPWLSRLLRDSDMRVRANAAWSMGFSEPDFAEEAFARLSRALLEPDGAVVGNAAVSLGRLSRVRPRVSLQLLCEGPLMDARSSVREQALRGLLLAQTPCANGRDIQLLARDPRARVRRAAAELLRSVAPNDARTRALRRCSEIDTSAVVAEACVGSPRGAELAVEPATILVVQPGRSEPTAGGPFALLLADGGLRLGATDRRGAVHEARTRRGELELLPHVGGD